MTIKRAEYDRIIAKFGFRVREGGDQLAFLEYKGRLILRTKRSNKQGDLPASNHIRQQMKLDDQQFRNAISCTLDLPGYLAILEAKGLLGSYTSTTRKLLTAAGPFDIDAQSDALRQRQT